MESHVHPGGLLSPTIPNGGIPPAVRWAIWALQGFQWNSMCIQVGSSIRRFLMAASPWLGNRSHPDFTISLSLHFRFRVFVFQIPGFWISGFGFRIFVFQFSGFRVSVIRIPDLSNPVSGFQ